MAYNMAGGPTGGGGGGFGSFLSGGGMSDILGGIGEYSSARQERKGWKRAREILKQLRDVADESAAMADPFAQYRGGLAERLNAMITGERSVETDPSYQFVFDEAMRGTERKLSAQGYGESGNILAALQERAAGLASQQYGSIIDRLQSLSGASPSAPQTAASIYGNIRSQGIQGEAEAVLGSAYASGRERAAKVGVLDAGISAGAKAFGLG